MTQFQRSQLTAILEKHKSSGKNHTRYEALLELIELTRDEVVDALQSGKNSANVNANLTLLLAELALSK